MDKRDKHRQLPRRAVDAHIREHTNHSLRRTFASLLCEAGASPAYVMAQMGHTSSALALEVYTKVMERKRDTGQRLDALLRGADWAPMGTRGADAEIASSGTETPEPHFSLS